MLKFEPAEVLEVFTDTLDESLIGAVRARFDVSQQNQPLKDASIFYPLDSNTLQVPVRGEEVLGCKFGGKYFYMSKLNKSNTATTDSNFGVSAQQVLDRESEVEFKFGKYFNPPSRVKKLLMREGDIYREGLVEDKSSEITIEEKSSLYLTTDEYVPYEDVGVKSTFDNNPTYFKPQVIIQSDRIVFNSKGDNGGIGIYSRDKVEIKSADKVEIDSPTIDIGSNNLSPAVLGNDDFVGFITILANQVIAGMTIQRTALLAASLGTETQPSLKLKDEIKRLEEVRDNKLYLSKKINVQ